ncbi:pyridoxamine 5'-phosphate oxidase family protein [Aestuariivirga sp. YIM B02566]|uniref:Pyridoxamine 5'-phosphate oxidase family protein n=1 Tax=Taklimakanibacter albus TaxID=2800327 RepID=A0ACC5RA29_9HYPH|nr:pyridoxamine 5'-phosphate oxidase family protein [Aestuariivirga sp. YIM B02566]MBK1869524.1 pyridoxamine 5'-phosphate oxidase family protein [Aestuariivirga sp. YIM B02566]
MLTEEMKSIIATYPLGFVASVNRDGTPNLSPKGTFVALNDKQLVFGHIRSPGTMGNIAERPVIEINFLDVLSRKAVRVRGRAFMFRSSVPQFADLFAALSGWKGYTEIMKAVVRVDVDTASLILSPAYDLGHTEAQLREQYKAKFTSL